MNTTAMFDLLKNAMQRSDQLCRLAPLAKLGSNIQQYGIQRPYFQGISFCTLNAPPCPDLRLMFSAAIEI